jgi:TetR/AcrR family transcriptional regulator
MAFGWMRCAAVDKRSVPYYITNQSVINKFMVATTLKNLPVSGLPKPKAEPLDAAEAAPRRERRKQARPGELLQAALDLFVEKGFAATRAEEVAARAGVSKGTLFLYFPSKEELFKAVVLENIAGRVREGFEELRSFTGPTAELVPHLMLQWWQRYGATQAAGISKLMMSEATNFPDLARFYQQEVVQPGRELIRQVLERGVKSGEFRQVDLDYAVYAVLAPIMFLIMWKYSLGLCCPLSESINPETYLRVQADIVVHGLLKHPATGANA